MRNDYLHALSAAYGYTKNNHYTGIVPGDEVIVLNEQGIPIVQDFVEEVTKEAVRICGQWYWDHDCHIRKIYS